ncbi:MAG: DegT/DnrJ/EryC1/StrS family aminotransferase [Planctomycetaceae bacterium]|nr:MAG: DegT/DnrJ/EryC1/StrS family aminotransferase [Planctomycetaceae bacterium]
MNIPFVDLKAHYQSIKDDIDNAIQCVINETAFIKGKYVSRFEEEYAEAYSVKHCISVANGTDAIYVTLKALGIGAGDEVITVANSWISTSETITQAGAKPVFVDIHPDYYTMDTSKIEEKITSRTKAVIPVHLYGQPAEIDKIKELCDSYNLYLIEDCAQAHFAEFKEQKTGTFGIAGTFSFFPGKNLGAYGDAGAIISNDVDFATNARMFANHGALEKHQHEREGINSRLDGIQAAILSVKLPHILDWNQKRLENAIYYSQLLSEVPDIITPGIHPDVKHVFHLYVIRTNARNTLQKHLGDNGISTGIHYPTPLPFLKAYDYLKQPPDAFPVAYKFKDEILSLPMYPELSREMIQYIVDNIKRFLNV